MKRPPFDTLPTPQPREEAVQATVRAATQAFRQREASRPPVPAGISPPAGPVPPQALVAAPGGRCWSCSGGCSSPPAPPMRSSGPWAPWLPCLWCWSCPSCGKTGPAAALEIECTAYYSLRQIYAARMVLFGLVDLALLTLFFSAALLAGQATLRDLIINFLLPFLVTGCICLRTLSHRRDTVCYAALPLCLAWTAVWVLLILSDQVYRMISLPMWLGMLLLATVYFLYAIRKLQNTCETIWEVSPVWH